MSGVGLVRLRKELKMLADEPPPGVCAWPVEGSLTHLQARGSFLELQAWRTDKSAVVQLLIGVNSYHFAQGDGGRREP